MLGFISRHASVLGLKDPAGADQVNQPQPFKIRVMFFGNLDESEGNASLGEVLLQFRDGTPGGKIQASDRGGIYSQPTNRPGRLMHECACLLAKECSVGVEEISAEPKHDQARLDHLARHGLL